VDLDAGMVTGRAGNVEEDVVVEPPANGDVTGGELLLLDLVR
jgi:hypothetical protein